MTTLLQTMTIEEKQAWLEKHGGNWHHSGHTDTESPRVLTLWYTPHSGKQFQGMGRTAAVADNRLFARVYRALYRMCVP